MSKLFVAAPFESKIGKTKIVKRYKEEVLSIIDDLTGDDDHDVWCGVDNKLYDRVSQSNGELNTFTAQHLRTANGLLAIVDEDTSEYVADTIGRALHIGKHIVIAAQDRELLRPYHEGIITVGKAQFAELPLHGDPFSK